MANKLPPELAKKKEATLETLRQRRLPFMTHWKELSDMYLPRRYIWLMPVGEQSRMISKNSYILDPSGTKAARTLASGMMNGITSPARPWFRLRVDGQFEDDSAVQIWLEECARRMLLVIAESNFYNAIAVLYMDLTVFNTATMLIYEDFEDVIRCYNPCAGEYYLANSDRMIVDSFYREFINSVAQVGERWDTENMSTGTQEALRAGGAALTREVAICHAIEPNTEIGGSGSKKGVRVLPALFTYREVYWVRGQKDRKPLSIRGFREKPFAVARWAKRSNEPYGANSPCMEALGDSKQVQLESLRKAEFIEKGVRPPMGADPALKNEPASIVPATITYMDTTGGKKGF